MVRALLRAVKLAGYFVRFGTELAIRRPETRAARADWLHRFCAAAMRGLGVAIDAVGDFPARGVLISNHTGYLDIVAYAAAHPCVFCAKAELRKWPVVGWMTEMTGTVLVERGRGASALAARAEMQRALDAGLPIVFFPEGTTTNGTRLLPFQSGLLAQALELEAPVTAAFVQYALAEDNPGRTVKDDVCWWGDRPVAGHILGFLRLRGVRAQVRFAPAPIRFAHGAKQRKLAALEAREAVLALAEASGCALDEPARMPRD